MCSISTEQRYSIQQVTEMGLEYYTFELNGYYEKQFLLILKNVYKLKKHGLNFDEI